MNKRYFKIITKIGKAILFVVSMVGILILFFVFCGIIGELQEKLFLPRWPQSGPKQTR